jgi:hypothetical protein
MAIQYESLRKGPARLDARFRSLVEELEVAYYQNWKLGNSHLFLGFDVQPTPRQSKALFDRLHGFIWDIYSLVFHILNKEQALGSQIDEERYRFKRDDGGTLLRDRITTTSARLNQIDNATDAGVIKTRVEQIFQRTFIWP